MQNIEVCCSLFARKNEGTWKKPTRCQNFNRKSATWECKYKIHLQVNPKRIEPFVELLFSRLTRINAKNKTQIINSFKTRIISFRLLSTQFWHKLKDAFSRTNLVVSSVILLKNLSLSRSQKWVIKMNINFVFSPRPVWFLWCQNRA